MLDAEEIMYEKVIKQLDRDFFTKLKKLDRCIDKMCSIVVQMQGPLESEAIGRLGDLCLFFRNEYRKYFRSGR